MICILMDQKFFTPLTSFYPLFLFIEVCQVESQDFLAFVGIVARGIVLGSYEGYWIERKWKVSPKIVSDLLANG